MDTQPNRNGRRRRRKKKAAPKSTTPTEPVIVAARRPDSPRLEKPTRRMKAASARPKTDKGEGSVRPGRLANSAAEKPRRQARMIQHREDEVDERERDRRLLLNKYLSSEGREAISKTADAYVDAGFELPLEQDVQIRLLEHFDETVALKAIESIQGILDEEQATQLPLLRQRLRRLEDHAEEENVRDAASALRRRLPAGS